MNKILKQVIAILVALGVLIGVYFAFSGLRDKNLSKIAVQKYSVVAGDVESVKVEKVNDSNLNEKFSAYNHKGELIAYLYEGTSRNGYGDITIIVSVGLNGNIIKMKAISVNQTLDVDRILDAINNFKGSVDEQVDGLTGVTFAKNTINEILSSIAKDFNEGGK